MQRTARWSRARWSRPSPLGALFRGLVAGAVGSLAQTLLFKATARVAPVASEDAFTPPDHEQRRETATETVARRATECLARRGPLSAEDKRRAAMAVHIGFGSLWGGLYGMARASMPGMGWPGMALGTLGFSTLVWGVSDSLILPAFRLGGRPSRYPLSVHAYALGAHVVYGLGTAATYEALCALSPGGTALAALGTMLTRRRRRWYARWWSRRQARRVRRFGGRVSRGFGRWSSTVGAAGKQVGRAIGSNVGRGVGAAYEQVGAAMNGTVRPVTARGLHGLSSRLREW